LTPPGFPIEPWAGYLAAFDVLLAAQSRRDVTGAIDARREMLAVLHADPEYWRARREHRDRVMRQRDAVAASVAQRQGRFGRRAA
jgi:hypothetical protein